MFKSVGGKKNTIYQAYFFLDILMIIALVYRFFLNAMVVTLMKSHKF